MRSLNEGEWNYYFTPLDTDSIVSIVSQCFHRQYLADQPIQTLNRILLIECADGEEMPPYQDYITVELELSGTVTSDRPHHCLLHHLQQNRTFADWHQHTESSY